MPQRPFVWIFACALGACGDRLPFDDSDSGTSAADLRVGAQALSPSTEVTVNAVRVDGSGWLTIREEEGQSAGAVIGVVGLAHGLHQDVEVVLDRPAIDGERFYAIVHEDTGAEHQFDFPDYDHPIAAAPFVVSVSPQTPAVRIDVRPIHDHAWEVVATDPPQYMSRVVGRMGENPTIRLERGWRYLIVNPAGIDHPFELITNTSGLDQVLLSQSDRPRAIFERDESIRWTESERIIGFTVSPSLERADGYRCGVHTESMRGVLRID
jgi:hypothetical protein